jgi:DNA invertase Pin-like site-specific DNA recombinase
MFRFVLYCYTQLPIFVTSERRSLFTRYKAHIMNIIAYYRVSTTKQGESGHGLDAQRAAVRAFARESNAVVAEYTEVESGKNDARPVLAQAIAHAKATDATLVIAKLDRLSRSASFIFSLRDSGVRFIACDMPEANTLTIGIMAVMAQHERELIAERTRKGLQARKARILERVAQDLSASVDSVEVEQAYRQACKAQAQASGLLEVVLPKARAASVASKQAQAATCEAWTRAAVVAKALRGNGQTLRSIAEQLNSSAFTTREGKPFHAQTVKRLLARG